MLFRSSRAVALLVGCLGAVALAGTAGCAHEAPPPATPTSVDVAHYPPTGEAPASWFETPRAPPRLSQTVRIGAADDAYTDARIYVDRPEPVRVESAPTPTYGYGYGYGYYGYGAYGGGRSGYGTPVRSFGTGAPARVGVGASHGSLPGVGGNWSAPPSYGPRFPFPSGTRGIDVTRR